MLVHCKEAAECTHNNRQRFKTTGQAGGDSIYGSAQLVCRVADSAVPAVRASVDAKKFPCSSIVDCTLQRIPEVDGEQQEEQQ